VTAPSNVPAETPAVPAVRVEHLHKVYQTAKGELVHALDDISLEVAQGEFVSVLGPSGCGKSTLMMIVAGLRSSTSGVVEVAGQTVTGPATDLGIVFQRDVLLDWRTNLDNVLLQTDIRKLPRADHVEHARELLHEVGLEGFEDKHPGELSGGMRQRVAICRALIHDPPLLLMDEPFGALDALTREDMTMRLQTLWLHSRKTVLFITHSISEAVFLSDRVIVMTPRPGRTDRVFDIELERPRHFESMSSADFGRTVNEIRDLFRATGVLATDV
jgi:NitT/TauT family transport system ATP-binding protein